MNIWQKWKNWLHYKNIINTNKKELLTTFNIKIDWIYRMYYDFTIDESLYKQYGQYANNETVIKNVGVYFTQEGNGFFEGELKKDLSRVDKYLKKIGLVNIYEEIDPLFGILDETYRKNELQQRVVIGYKYFNQLKYYNTLLVLGVISVSSLFISFFLVFILKFLF